MAGKVDIVSRDSCGRTLDLTEIIYRLILKLIKPMVAEVGQRFTIRDGQVTVGTGVITKLLPSLTTEEKEILEKGHKKVEREKEKAARKK